MKTYTKEEARLNLSAQRGSNEITITVTGTLLKQGQFTFRLPQDEARREALQPEEGGEWAGKSPHLVVRREAAPDRTVWTFGIDLGDGQVVAENKTTILNPKPAAPAKPAPAPKPVTAVKPAAPAKPAAAPKPVPAVTAVPPPKVTAPSVPAVMGHDSASWGNAQQGMVTVSVAAAFHLKVTSGGQSCEVYLLDLKPGREQAFAEGVFRLKLELFQMRGEQPVKGAGVTLRITFGKLTFPFWVAADGLKVDSLQGHESAIIGKRLAAASGQAGPFALDKALASLPRRDHHHGHHHGGGQSHGNSSRPQDHGQRPAAQPAPQKAPPAAKPAAQAPKPAAPPKAEAPQTAPAVTPPPAQPAKADAGGDGGGKQALVQLELPPNSITQIVVDTRGETPKAAALTKERPAGEVVAAEAPPALVAARTTETENSQVGETVEVTRQTAPTAVEPTVTVGTESVEPPARETVPPAPAADDKSPMAKFLRRQAATAKMQRNTSAAPAAKPKERGKGTVSLAELDESLLKPGT